VNDWLEPVAQSTEEATGATLTFSVVASLALALAGIWLAWRWYGHPSDVPERARSRWAWAARTLEHKFYFDEAYDFAFYRPAVFLANGLTRWVERPLVFGSVRELVKGFGLAGRDTSRLQTGLVRSYVLAIAASLAVLTVVFVAVR
jgi:NADH-quinone oxidoreductase subunit L